MPDIRSFEHVDVKITLFTHSRVFKQFFPSWIANSRRRARLEQISRVVGEEEKERGKEVHPSYLSIRR